MPSMMRLLDFRAQPLGAALAVHVEEVFAGLELGAAAVTHAVEAGKIAGGLGEGDDVVRGDSVLGVRKIDIDDGRA